MRKKLPWFALFAMLFAWFGKDGRAQPLPNPFVYTGVLANIPSGCSVGQVSFITDATAGQNIYECTTANTWTQQSGGGASPAGSLGCVQLYATATTFAGCVGTKALIGTTDPGIPGELLALQSSTTALTAEYQFPEKYVLNLAANETQFHYANHTELDLNGTVNYRNDAAIFATVEVNTTGTVGVSSHSPAIGSWANVDINSAVAGDYSVGLFGSVQVQAGTNNQITGVWSWLGEYGGTIAIGANFYGQAPDIGATITTNYGYFQEALGGTASNAFPVWLDDQGVFAIHAMNTFNAVYQARPALYNPQFTKFSIAQLNANSYERGVAQWESNVYAIRTEAGSGAGTLRQITLDGAQVNLGSATHQVNVLGHESIEGVTSTGSTGTGNFVFSISPVFTGTPAAPTPAATDNSTTVATTAYVTTGIANAVTAAAGRDLVQAATAAVLPNTPTFTHVDAGVGSFYTSSTNSVLVVDGYTPLLLDRILVKNQATAAQNGIYSVTQLGVGGVTPWIMTRTLDYDQPADMNNTIVPVANHGTANPLTSWIMTSTVATVDTDAVNFASFTPAGANIVTAVSPGVGLAHFAGSTQTVTSSAVALGGADVSGVLLGANGGTGIANTGFTITLAGNLVTTGAFNTTFAAGGTATMTLPTTSQTIPGMNQTNTAGSSMVWDLSAASTTAGLKIPATAGAVPTADDFVAFNTTNHTFVWGSNGTTEVGAVAATGTGTSTTCTNQVFTVISSLVAPTCTTITNTFTNSTVMGIGAATTGAVTIGSAATDIKVVELSLPAAYLNTANKTFRIEARGIYTTTGITPTLTHKVKLCTVSGCGSGTVLVLYSAPATGATTSGASNTWIVQGALGTIATGATGTVMLHADACTVLGASGATACTPTIDANTAASSTIDLTAALFLDWMVNASAVTTLTETPNVAFIKPMD